MKHQKKIFIAVIIILILAVGTIPTVNYFVDPFGAFSRDNFWYAYSMTRNPRTAKISYIDAHEGYDAYVVGSSGASVFLVDKLNEATSKSYYNAFFFGPYMPDVEKTIYYLIDEKQAKTILFPITFAYAEKTKREQSMRKVLHIKASKENVLDYYLDFLFNDLRYSTEKIETYKKRTGFPDENAVFIPETGNYDKRKRDTKSVTSLEKYIEETPLFDYQGEELPMNKMDEFFESLDRVIEYCDKNAVDLDIVLYPIYEKAYKRYNADEINDFYARLSERTDYWDFALSSLSYDPRFFYDLGHGRTVVGDMMISKMYGLKGVYVPDDFGTYVKQGQKHIAPQELSFDEASQKELKVFLFHAIGEADEEKKSISQEKLEELLQMLKEKGYESVDQEQILAYVKEGKVLPDKPVVLSFDDGYYSAYEKAFPLLKKYETKAIFFPVGVSIGKDTYRHTDIAVEPHYGYEEIDEILASSLVEIGSHSYDMHRIKELETGEDIIREDMIKHRFETLESYTKEINQDFKYFRGKWKRYKDIPLIAFAYPQGKHDEYTDILVAQNGFELTYTEGDGKNYLLKGLPQSALGLNRIEIKEDTVLEDLLEASEVKE